MKTTIEISDPLLREVRALASQEGQTLREAVDAGLRQWVAARKRRRRFTLRDASVEGRGLQAGVEYDQWGRILEIAYGERA
jgi:hypothetical protein